MHTRIAPSERESLVRSTVALAQSGRSVILFGEPGTGKTTISLTVVTRIVAEGQQVTRVHPGAEPTNILLSAVVAAPVDGSPGSSSQVAPVETTIEAFQRKVLTSSGTPPLVYVDDAQLLSTERVN